MTDEESEKPRKRGTIKIMADSDMYEKIEDVINSLIG